MDSTETYELNHSNITPQSHLHKIIDSDVNYSTTPGCTDNKYK